MNTSSSDSATKSCACPDPSSTMSSNPYDSSGFSSQYQISGSMPPSLQFSSTPGGHPDRQTSSSYGGGAGSQSPSNLNNTNGGSMMHTNSCGGGGSMMQSAMTAGFKTSTPLKQRGNTSGSRYRSGSAHTTANGLGDEMHAHRTYLKELVKQNRLMKQQLKQQNNLTAPPGFQSSSKMQECEDRLRVLFDEIVDASAALQRSRLATAAAANATYTIHQPAMPASPATSPQNVVVVLHPEELERLMRPNPAGNVSDSYEFSGSGGSPGYAYASRINTQDIYTPPERYSPPRPEMLSHRAQPWSIYDRVLPSRMDDSTTQIKRKSRELRKNLEREARRHRRGLPPEPPFESPDDGGDEEDSFDGAPPVDESAVRHRIYNHEPFHDPPIACSTMDRFSARQASPQSAHLNHNIIDSSQELPTDGDGIGGGGSSANSPQVAFDLSSTQDSGHEQTQSTAGTAGSINVSLTAIRRRSAAGEVLLMQVVEKYRCVKEKERLMMEERRTLRRLIRELAASVKDNRNAIAHIEQSMGGRLRAGRSSSEVPMQYNGDATTMPTTDSPCPALSLELQDLIDDLYRELHEKFSKTRVNKGRKGDLYRLRELLAAKELEITEIRDRVRLLKNKLQNAVLQKRHLEAEFQMLLQQNGNLDKNLTDDYCTCPSFIK